MDYLANDDQQGQDPSWDGKNGMNAALDNPMFTSHYDGPSDHLTTWLSQPMANAITLTK